MKTASKIIITTNCNFLNFFFILKTFQILLFFSNVYTIISSSLLCLHHVNTANMTVHCKQNILLNYGKNGCCGCQKFGILPDGISVIYTTMYMLKSENKQNNVYKI